MGHLSEKLLTVLLILLLGFSPVQVFAAASVDQGWGMQPPSGSASGVSLVADKSAAPQDCVLCDTNQSTVNTCCSVDHCTSVALMPFPAFFQPANLLSISRSRHLDPAPSSRFPTLVFRPPRA